MEKLTNAVMWLSTQQQEEKQSMEKLANAVMWLSTQLKLTHDKVLLHERTIEDILQQNFSHLRKGKQSGRKIRTAKQMTMLQSRKRR